MAKTKNSPKCMACGRGPDEVPLLTLRYQKGKFKICPQHLPVLIHDPHRFIGTLPGAENLAPAEVKDH